MKSINFKRNESVLRYNKENKQKIKKKYNWDRIIYFIILGLILFLLVRWVVLNSIYTEANGQVIFENRNIQNVDDCRILEYKVKEGDEVEKGDTLFIYMSDEDEVSSRNGGGSSSGALTSQISVGDISITKIKSPDWIDREMFNARKQIALNSIQVNENTQLINILRKNLSRMEQEVVLDVLPKSRLEESYMRLETLEADLQQHKQENTFYKKHLRELEALKVVQEAIPKPKNTGISIGNKSNNGSSNGGGSQEDHKQAFICPIDGSISRIFKEEFEVALKSEIIMSVLKPKNVKIKAYIQQEDIDQFDIGDEVTVLFPDDSESKGVIDKFHPTTSRIPEEFQKKYEPTTRSIIVDVLPLTEKASIKWQLYYKLGVTIRKSKL